VGKEETELTPDLTFNDFSDLKAFLKIG